MTIEQYEAPTHEVDVPRQAGALALSADQMDWTTPQQAALVQLGIADAPKADQQVFMHVAQRSGLDPFARQIYLIGRKDKEAPGGKKWTIQTGIDGFRVMAERRPEYAGQTAPQWCDSNGQWFEVWLNRDAPPAAARIGVYRSDREQITWAVAHFWEFAQTKWDGELNAMWKGKPANQIAKCAEAAALRKAFPQDFSGLYISEEMDAAENGSRAPMRAKAQRTNVSVAALTGNASKPARPVESEPEQPAAEMIDKQQWTDITGHFKAADVPGPDRGPVVDQIVGREVGGMKNLTHDEAANLAARLAELGPTGVARAAGIEVAEHEDEPTEAEYVPDPAADPWAAEADKQ